MVTQSAELRTDESPTRQGQGVSPTAAALVFAGGVALVLLYALRGGGSYDIVAYEENGLVIWWLLAVGIALGLLPRARPSRGALVLLAALLGYAAWTALSLTWTDSKELTFAEVARVLDYLGLVALVGSVLDAKTSRPAAAGLVFGAFVVCVVAVGSRLAPSIFGHDEIDSLLHIDRLSRPFGYWNAVGAWGAMCSALGLAWSAHDRVAGAPRDRAGVRAGRRGDHLPDVFPRWGRRSGAGGDPGHRAEPQSPHRSRPRASWRRPGPA